MYIQRIGQNCSTYFYRYANHPDICSFENNKVLFHIGIHYKKNGVRQ